MLTELHVRDLGVIADLTLQLGRGMTAITGETGAGKTLVVEAIALLLGGRAEPVMVRPGADEARVEGRFVLPAPSVSHQVPGEGGSEPAEVILARSVPAAGRSRAYVDGGLATAAELTGIGRRLVDLHGQHAHQSLLSSSSQRHALDRFGEVDLGPLATARSRLSALDDALAALGGDARAQAREMDLLRFQLAELEAAAVSDPDEDEHLARLEDRLAGAFAHREAGETAHGALSGDGGAVDRVGEALKACGGRAPFEAVEARLAALQAELAEVTADLRIVTEGIVEDPERLDGVRARRQLLAHLRRKYGERLADVMAYESEVRARLDDLESRGRRVAELEQQRDEAVSAVASAAGEVRRARLAAAPGLSAAVQERLRVLAMPAAAFGVEIAGLTGPNESPDARSDDSVVEGPGDEVRFLIAANPGEPLMPLARVASGGELSRVMLAARLVTTDAPPVLVFDEVDAGIGGQVAVAVGRALAQLSRNHQVLVVTHLPQVAAFADHQVAVTKQLREGRTVAEARGVDGEDRVVELSRMLSGQPDSLTARKHAEELLCLAAEDRAGQDRAAQDRAGRDLVGDRPAGGKRAG